MAALVDWASLLFFFGSSVSYLVIIGDSFGVAVAPWGEGPFYRGGVVMHYSVLSLLLLVAFTLLCLAPLSMLRSMDSLQVTSCLGMLCLAYTVVIILLSPASPSAEPGRSTAPIPFALSSQTLLSLPTLTFCFSSQSLFPPALETLHQPATYEYLHGVVSTTMWVTLLIHLAVGLGGYCKFGSSVEANILDALPQTTAVSAARLAIVFAFAFTFPMMIFLCRMHIYSILARTRLVAQQTNKPSAEATPSPNGGGVDVHHGLVSAMLVGASLLVAICFPNIDVLFGLLGGTTSVVISFVAPAVFWESFVGNIYPELHPKRIFCKVLFGFSIVVAGLSLPSVLVDLLGDLYATAWWVPMASSAGMHSWKGGLMP